MMASFSGKPREINVVKFVKERASEISDLLAVIDNHNLPSGEVTHGPRSSTRSVLGLGLPPLNQTIAMVRTFLQRMPRHLRRRAMSYNVKRLPRRLQGHCESVGDETKHRKKPPSRYHRRRPSNLLQAYARRQRKNNWLETHIWHAKRFHMVDHWGYKVADRSCARGFRASYRDAKNHCLIQDISHWSCIQLQGTLELLVERLAVCCSQAVGLTFKFRAAQSGGREVSVVLYRPNQYPYGCIGPVRYQWIQPDSPRQEGQEGRRTLCIWTHPSIHQEVIDVLQTLFDFEKQREGSEEEHFGSGDPPPETLNDVHLTKLRVQQKVRESQKFPGVSLTELKDGLVRFRLIGSKSSEILKSVCRFADFSRLDSSRLKSVEEGGKRLWWHKYLEENRVSVKKQAEDWDSLGIRSHGNLPDGKVFPLLIRDPRLLRSAKKQFPNTPQHAQSTLNNAQSTFHDEYSESCIWNEAVREACLKEKRSDFSLHEIRRKQPFPGLPTIENEWDVSLVPALAIAHVPSACLLSGRKGRPNRSVQAEGFGSGWDLVLPLGWAMPFWIAFQFQYATARAGGVREERTIGLESGRLCFPDDWPDTSGGMEEEVREEGRLKIQHERKPWNRRPRYTDNGIKFPFKFGWTELVEGWRQGRRGESPAPEGIREQFFVLRDKRDLRQLSLWVHSGGESVDSGTVEALFARNSCALVPVRIESRGKGRPCRRSIICIPNEEDLKVSEGKEGLEEKRGRVESVMEEKEEEEEAREWPEEDFLSLRRETPLEMEDLFPDTEKEEAERKKEKMKEKKKNRKRKLPNPKTEEVPMTENVVRSVWRGVIGFVSRGDMSFSVGKGVGMGYCSLLGLRELVKSQKGGCQRAGITVMFRNVTCRKYRKARMDILG